MREREEAAGARRGQAPLHHALQPRRLHGHDEPQQGRDQEEGGNLNSASLSVQGIVSGD